MPTSTDLFTPDGTVRWMHGTGRLYYDEQGQAIRMTGVVQDITEQKQAETVLDLRARQQQALAALGMVVLRQRNFQTVCNLAVECIVRTLDVELCKVLELLPSGQEVLLRAGIGWQEGLVGRATVSAGMHSQAGYTLAADKAVIVEDMRTETRFSGPPLLHDHGVVSGMSCIILGAEDRPWGVLGAHTTSLSALHEGRHRLSPGRRQCARRRDPTGSGGDGISQAGRYCLVLRGRHRLEGLRRYHHQLESRRRTSLWIQG